MVASIGENQRGSRARTLSKCDRKILAAWANPEYFGLSASELAKAAGVAESTLRLAMKDAWMVEQQRQLAHSIVRGRVRDAMDALVKTALIVGREGDQARKLLFEMTGDYTQKQQIEQHLTVRPVDVPAAPETIEEWYERSRKIRELAAPGAPTHSD